MHDPYRSGPPLRVGDGGVVVGRRPAVRPVGRSPRPCAPSGADTPHAEVPHLVARDAQLGILDRAIAELERRLRQEDLDVTARYYAGASHEVLNETSRDEVHADLRVWLAAFRARS
jgi:alpha-beta hydrolase superfamily lysophospholipase